MHRLRLEHVSGRHLNARRTKAGADSASILLLLGLRNHAELGNEIERFLHVQVERLQRRIYSDLVLVEALGLGDALEGLDGATDEV